VFVTVYIPFFAAAVLAHDWPRPRQKQFVGGLFALDALLILVFGPILGWI
jgi:MFS-type transporter involved in bile tolerance (Atg22 family)